MNAPSRLACARRYTLVPGFPDYLIGRDGRLFSLVSGAFLNPWRHASGHCYVHLSSPTGGRIQAQVHRLVLEAFVGPAPDGYDGCHADGDPTNNALENLRWAPRAENIEDYRRLHRRHWRARLTIDQAQQIREAYQGRRGEQRLLAKRYGVSKSVITDLLAGRTYQDVACNSR